jgi:Bacteriophage tail sheath protein
MPDYLYPGVYVEEVDTGNKPIEGVSTSTVGFLGIAERGPLQPTLITCFSDFTGAFGSYVKAGQVDRYLAYAVEGFFQNGGERCFVMRVAAQPPPSLPSAPPPSPPYASLTSLDGGMLVQALGPGNWGNRIAVQTAQAGLQNTGLFKLLVAYWTTDPLPNPIPDLTNSRELSLSPPTVLESFDDLSAIPASSTFYESQVNGVSNLITLTQLTPGVPKIDSSLVSPPLGSPLASSGAMALGSGQDKQIEPADFTGELSGPDNKVGLLALGDIDEISILCCPDEFYFTDDASNSVIRNALVQQCEDLQYRFAILQAPLPVQSPENNNPTVNSARGYAAFYFPWLQVINSITGVPLLIPPGGHIAGIYARSDTNRGVHKDPANEVILGINQLQLQINNQDQAILNPKGVNCLRYFKGQGNLVWGGRTTSPDPDWKYINVRRLFIFVEQSIQLGTQWVVFEPNDATLWARARRSVTDFLTGLWMDGMLQGATKDQAFFVRCDQTTMTQADLDNGRFIMLIGIAAVKPAEFVIFRIGQYSGGGSDVTESQ